MFDECTTERSDYETSSDTIFSAFSSNSPTSFQHGAEMAAGLVLAITTKTRIYAIKTSRRTKRNKERRRRRRKSIIDLDSFENKKPREKNGNEEEREALLCFVSLPSAAGPEAISILLPREKLTMKDRHEKAWSITIIIS